MSKTVERAVHGPSWTEIILGIVLSLILGVVLGAAVLIIRPVTTVKELPKPEDQKAGAVYYVEGSRDSAKARQAEAKRAAFVQGQTVSLDENELNALAGTKPAPAAAAKDPKAPADAPAFAPGQANFRIRDSQLQIAVPVTINAAGLGQKVMVIGQGTFAKGGDKFVFEPARLYVGSCPVEKIPFLSTYVRDHLLVPQPVPEDVAAAWNKLANVTVEGNQLTLTAP
jgi:hypothetical protein